jgi:hypothetical protein
MQTFEQLSDLAHLPATDPARSVIHEILDRLSRLTEQEGRPYQASIDGSICLAGPKTSIALSMKYCPDTRWKLRPGKRSICTVISG